MVFSRTLAMTEVVALYQSAPLYPQSLHPAANAIGAALSTDISVTYGHPISPSSVTSRTFAVHGMQSGLLTGAYAVSGGAVTLIPDRPLHAGELVRASACDGI